ncbi:MAG: RNA polymerase sigma factor [Vicinamibacterales bacterium]
MLTRVWAGPVPNDPAWKVTVAGRPSTAEGSVESFADAPDAALVDACLAGRREAFDVIVERHRRHVYQLCYRFVGNHEDASDLAQDVFIRAYRGLHRFRNQASLGTWLYRIGVNVCLNKLSSKAPRPEPLERLVAASDERIASHDESASESLLRGERAAHVRAAIARLPRKQRATLILRVYHELPHEQIASILGSSVGAVKANFFHALNNLRKLLRTDMETGQ